MANSDRLPALATGAFLLLLGLAGAPAPAAAQDDAEARLRAALRSATIQLRQLQDEYAGLQAKQAESERQRLEATQKLAEDEKVIAGLHQDLSNSQKSVLQSAQKLQATSSAYESERNNLTKLQSTYNQTVTAANARDEEAKHLEATLIETRKRALSCEAKNGELYKLGIEALDLYDHKGLFDVLATGEPVTQLKRVELENLIQDKKDKMRDNRITYPAQ